MKAKRAILWVAVSSLAQAEDEKDSLPEQERRLRAIADERGWQVVDLITVPGHSRVYYNYPEFASAALIDGMTGPARMLEHWQRRDFDVFACVAGDRFGRAASIFNEVVERTYDAGAQVFTMRDGLIERGNEGTWAVMASYAASSEVKELKRRHKFGMNKRAEKGLPVSSRILFSHRVIRDELGRAQKYVVKEELRPMFNDLAQVLLDRVPYFSVERELFERYGHVAANGLPYPNRFFHAIVIAPVFWGHNARNFADRKTPYSRHRGGWMLDDSEPSPEGVLIFYNTHEPVYSGELAALVKGELRRRMTLRGGGRPDSKYPFSLLFECQECGNRLSWTTTRNHYRGARCNLAYGLLPNSKKTCSQRKYMTEAYVYEYMRALVDLLVSADDVTAFLNSLTDTTEAEDETPLLEQQLADLEEEGRTLIQMQLKAHKSTSKLFEEQMDVLGQRVEIIQSRLEAAKRNRPSPFEAEEQHQAIGNIRMLGDKFWQLPPGELNQLLRRALGMNRRVFQVREGKIRRLKMKI